MHDKKSVEKFKLTINGGPFTPVPEEPTQKTLSVKLTTMKTIYVAAISKPQKTRKVGRKKAPRKRWNTTNQRRMYFF